MAVPSENAAIPSNLYYEDTGIYVEHSGNFTEHDPSEIAPHPSNFYHGETSNYVEPSVDFSEGDAKPVIGGETSELGNEQAFFELPAGQYLMDPSPAKEEYFVQSSNYINHMDVNHSFGGQFLDVIDSPPFGGGLYLETNDLSKPIDEDPTDFDLSAFLAFSDTEDDDAQHVAADSSQIARVENAVTEQEPQESATGEAEVVPMGTQQAVKAHDNNEASFSNEKTEVTKSESDFKHPFLKQASQVLGSIPAPPAFASEFPTKEAALHLNSAAQSSSSVHLTAGMIRIRNLNLDGNGADWTSGKNGQVDLVLSYYGLPQAGVNASTMVPMAGTLSGKTGSVVTKGWFLYMFIWVLIMSVSFKVGNYIYTRSCFDS